MVSLALSAFTSAYLRPAHRSGTAPSLHRGSVVHGIDGTMGRSDSRSALPRFTGALLIGFVAPSPRPGWLPGFHSWGGDGPLLFPHRLSRHSAPSTPPGSSGLHLQALHPFLGLRPPWPGSAPGWSLSRGQILSTRQVSLHATDWRVAPSAGFPARARPRASAPGSLRTLAGCYKGGLVPPLAGLPPASRCELAGRTHGGIYMLTSTASAGFVVALV